MKTGQLAQDTILLQEKQSTPEEKVLVVLSRTIKIKNQNIISIKLKLTTISCNKKLKSGKKK